MGAAQDHPDLSPLRLGENRLCRLAERIPVVVRIVGLSGVSAEAALVEVDHVGAAPLGGGDVPACVPDWNCTSWADCGVNYRKECLAVEDIACSSTFTGDETDYNEDCDWCDDNPTLEICSTERNNMYMLILIPLALSLFCLIGAATLNDEHVALKIGLFILSFLGAIGAAYIGSNIVSTSDAQVQTALGITTNWMVWVFIIIVFYFLIYLIYKMFDHVGRQKREKLEY